MNDLPADGAAWRKLILDRMWEFLKPRGFKKDGTTFRRKTSEGYLVVNLQSSQWNTKFDLMVMVNLGVYYEALPLSQPLSKSGPRNMIAYGGHD